MAQSFSCWVSDDGGQNYAQNALRFATKEEADKYGRDLRSRWMAMTDYEVRESNDPVNYAIIDDVLKSLDT